MPPTTQSPTATSSKARSLSKRDGQLGSAETTRTASSVGCIGAIVCQRASLAAQPIGAPSSFVGVEPEISTIKNPGPLSRSAWRLLLLALVLLVPCRHRLLICLRLGLPPTANLYT